VSVCVGHPFRSDVGRRGTARGFCQRWRRCLAWSDRLDYRHALVRGSDFNDLIQAGGISAVRARIAAAVAAPKTEKPGSRIVPPPFEAPTLPATEAAAQLVGPIASFVANASIVADARMDWQLRRGYLPADAAMLELIREGEQAGSRDHDPVVARQHGRQPIPIPIRQKWRHAPPPTLAYSRRILTCLAPALPA
jgi:hypothetical protein